MTNFRELASQMDNAIFDHLADKVKIGDEYVEGIFQEPWSQPRLGGLQTELIEPVVVVRQSDAERAHNREIVKFQNRNYEIVNIEPDGTGMMALVLREII